MCEQLEVGAERKGRLYLVVYYRAEGEAEGFDLEKTEKNICS